MNASVTVLDALRCIKSGQIDSEDVQHFFRWGAIGFLSLGVYKLSTQIVGKNILASSQLTDMTESIHLDPKLCNAFVQLQGYRKLNPWLFRTSLQNADHLLFLENILIQGNAIPVRNDKIIAFTHFRMCLTRMNEFVTRIKAKMGNGHGLAAKLYMDVAIDQMKKHLLNVLHECSKFKPQDLISRAEEEIKNIKS